jgi:hypothetical protein
VFGAPLAASYNDVISNPEVQIVAVTCDSVSICISAVIERVPLLACPLAQREYQLPVNRFA